MQTIDKAEETTEDITPQMLFPTFAVEIGYNMYVAESGDSNSPITRSATIALEQFERLIDLPVSSKGGIYCLHLRLAANSLAKAIVRLKEKQKKQEKVADDELKQLIDEMSQGEKSAGRVKAMWNTLLAGGVVFFFAQSWFGITMEKKNPGMQSLTLALALAATLAWIELRSWMSRRSRRRMYANHKQAIKDADSEYQWKADMEYKLSANLAELGWEQMTDKKPPVTEGFKNLLRGAITNWSPDIENLPPN